MRPRDWDSGVFGPSVHGDPTTAGHPVLDRRFLRKWKRSGLIATMVNIAEKIPQLATAECTGESLRSLPEFSS